MQVFSPLLGSTTLTTVGEMMDTTTTSPLAAHSIPTTTNTMLQLCKIWPQLNRSLPEPFFCRDLLASMEDTTNTDRDPASWKPQNFLFGLPHRHSESNHMMTGEKVGIGIEMIPEMHTYTGKSMSLIGVLGGILVILVVIAVISCIKHRKRTNTDEQMTVEMFTSHIRQLQQMSSSQQLLYLRQEGGQPPAPPPDYETVVKQREEEENQLPTYLEAVEIVREKERLSSSSSRDDSTATDDDDDDNDDDDDDLPPDFQTVTADITAERESRDDSLPGYSCRTHQEKEECKIKESEENDRPPILGPELQD